LVILLLTLILEDCEFATTLVVPPYESTKVEVTTAQDSKSIARDLLLI
jgi:hypothetical protein